MEELFAQTAFAKRFELQKALGVGATIVYAAQDHACSETVVLKFLDIPTHAGMRLHLLSNLRASLRLHSPSVVNTREVISATSCVCLVLEHLQGQTLAELIRPGAALPIEEGVIVLQSVARGLSDIHRAGLMHRDLKLDNVMITSKGEVKIVDLGLLRPIEVSHRHLDDATWIHSAEWIVGTPANLPPEYFRSGTFDVRSELYTLGCLAFELITGQHPFPQSDFLALVSAKLSTTSQSVEAICQDCPPALGAWISKLLHIDPEQRFQTVAEAFDDLRKDRPRLSQALPRTPIVIAHARRDLEKVLGLCDRTSLARPLVVLGEPLLKLPDARLSSIWYGLLLASMVGCLAVTLTLFAYFYSLNDSNPEFERTSHAIVQPEMVESPTALLSNNCDAYAQPEMSRILSQLEKIVLIVAGADGHGCEFSQAGLKQLDVLPKKPISPYVVSQALWPRRAICERGKGHLSGSCPVVSELAVRLPVRGAAGIYFVMHEDEDVDEVWLQPRRGGPMRQMTSLHLRIAALSIVPSSTTRDDTILLLARPADKQIDGLMFAATGPGTERLIARFPQAPKDLFAVEVSG